MEVRVTRTDSDELMHYGVPGMKWGVRRAQYKTSQNERLNRKALNYDVKVAKLNKKAEKIHAEKDLGRANRAAKKAAKYSAKSAKLQKRALKKTNEFARSNLERRAAKANLKSATKRIEADQLSKLTGYGSSAMKYSTKANKVARKAAKARYKMANNKRYIAKMNHKMSELPEQNISKGRDYVDSLKER